MPLTDRPLRSLVNRMLGAPAARITRLSDDADDLWASLLHDDQAAHGEVV